MTKSGDQRVHKLFMDPTGTHVLFTVVSSRDDSAHNYYLHSSHVRPLELTKANKGGVVIESVAWPRKSGPESTGNILVGTS